MADLVGAPPAGRRRLVPSDRRAELLQACLKLIGMRPWDEVSMADVALAAGVSKPLLYHYFPTKRDLYRAAVQAAAQDLLAATTPLRDLPAPLRLERALTAHLDWIEANAVAYRAILQGGISSDDDVQAIIEQSRSDVMSRLADGYGFSARKPEERVVLRAWVGFLEAACLDWLMAKELSKPSLVRMLTASLAVVIPAVEAGRI